MVMRAEVGLSRKCAGHNSSNLSSKGIFEPYGDKFSQGQALNSDLPGHNTAVSGRLLIYQQ